MLALNLLLVFVVAVAVPGVGLFLIASRTSGRPRSLGMLGCGLLAVQGLLQLVYQAAIPYLYRQLGVSGIGVLSGVYNLIASLAGAAGLALVIAAVIAGRSAPTRPAQPYPGGAYPPTPTYPTDHR